MIKENRFKGPSADEILREAEGRIGDLVPLEAHILRLRFGLSGGKQHTPEELANKFGFTKEKIEIVERSALEKLGFEFNEGESIELVSDD